jgi:hypothetical protein
MELAARFDTSSGPLLRATLVRGDAVSELILAAHHSIGDGISAMYLVRDLLEVMEGHQLDELPARASLEELAGVTEMSGAQPPVPAESGQVGRPSVASIASAQIEPALLKALLDRSRKEGTTLEGALLAAILLDGPIDGCLAPVSVRNLCPGISDDFGVYISSGTALPDPNSTQDFWTVARNARNRVARALNLEVLQARNAGMGTMVAANNDPRSASAALHRLVNYSAVLSNLGQFPLLTNVMNFRITAVYPVLNVELEPIVAVATVHGRMTITTTRDDSTGADWIRSILNRLQTRALA